MDATPRYRFPSDPGHPDHEMFERLQQGVRALGRWDLAESRNLAAGLYRNLRQKQPHLSASDVGAITLGDPNAPIPSLFATPRDGFHQHSPDPLGLLFSAPVALARVPANETLTPFRREITIDADGYLTDPGIVRTSIARISHAPMPQVNAIVLHRTESSTAQSTLSTWLSREAGTGAHFLIDRDGTIHQTVSVDRQAWHVGAVRSRGEVEGTITPEDQRELDSVRNGQPEWRGSAVRAVSRVESTRPYPERYPTNADSIGIEVVGRYRPATQTWDAPTQEQSAAINRLVASLQRNFGINDGDVYEHDVISRKTPGEGAGLYTAGAARDHASPDDVVERLPVHGLER